MKVEDTSSNSIRGGGAYVGIAGEAHDVESHWAGERLTAWSTALLFLGDGTTAIYPDISKDGEQHLKGAGMNKSRSDALQEIWEDSERRAGLAASAAASADIYTQGADPNEADNFLELVVAAQWEEMKVKRPTMICQFLVIFIPYWFIIITNVWVPALQISQAGITGVCEGGVPCNAAGGPWGPDYSSLNGSVSVSDDAQFAACNALVTAPATGIVVCHVILWVALVKEMALGWCLAWSQSFFSCFITAVGTNPTISNLYSAQSVFCSLCLLLPAMLVSVVFMIQMAVLKDAVATDPACVGLPPLQLAGFNAFADWCLAYTILFLVRFCCTVLKQVDGGGGGSC
jgi:hypothetical protein